MAISAAVQKGGDDVSASLSPATLQVGDEADDDGASGLLRSLLLLAPLLVAAPFYALRIHYALPAPVAAAHDAAGRPHVSEARALAVARHLSEHIGYRTVGTREHAQGDVWMFEQVQQVQAACAAAVARAPGRRLQCEIWHQRGSGAHGAFDMMNKRLYKTYVNLSNIVLRVSAGTPDSKAHAVLVNAHVDSTLPSPGAADDAISVGVMLECARVLIETDDWEPAHAIVFLFNNAEESLQDGSHLFSTQHEVAPTIRAAINLEAAGSTGRELLFQATSEEMIAAYAHVPRPMGTVVAANVFETGVMLSDTDFRQFVEYLNVSGLDMAIVGNSYLYHMRKDLVENIQPGVAQHMAENALALLTHLSSADSPLPRLAGGFTPPTTVYFSYLAHFYMYSARAARIAYAALLLASGALVWRTWADPAPALKRRGRGDRMRGMIKEVAHAAGAVGAGVLGALGGANVLALAMQRGGKGMSWFSVEFSCLGLYGPAGMAGALAAQLLVGPVRERALLHALLLLQAVGALGVQLAGVGSAAMLMLLAAPLFVALSVDAVLALSRGEKGERGVGLWVYALAQTVPLLTGAQLVAVTMDVFVPLTGRVGADAPAEHIVASIVAFVGCYTLPLALPFAHRFGRRTLARAALGATALTALSAAYFATRNPFDGMHQKRVFVMHLENTTTLEQHLHVAAADGAPGLEPLLAELAGAFGAPGVQADRISMDEWNSDWDVLYPFSSFLRAHKFGLDVDPLQPSAAAAGVKIRVSAVNETVDAVAGTRSFTLQIEHPGVIWTALAFDAHVLKWSLDDSPPDERARHHIKEASFYGEDVWSVDLVVKIPPSSDADANAPPGLSVSHVGIREQAMWPGKRHEAHLGGRAMALFADVDAWLDARTGGTVDALLIGCVGGVTVV